MHAFPTGAYCDQVDANSGAFNKLVGAQTLVRPGSGLDGCFSFGGLRGGYG
jgi:hypothetical protein